MVDGNIFQNISHHKKGKNKQKLSANERPLKIRLEDNRTGSLVGETTYVINKLFTQIPYALKAIHLDCIV